MALFLGLAAQSYVLPAGNIYLQPPRTVSMQEKPHYYNGGPNGQPTIQGLTREQVMARARKAAAKDDFYCPDPTKHDGKSKNNVVTTGWHTLD